MKVLPVSRLSGHATPDTSAGHVVPRLSHAVFVAGSACDNLLLILLKYIHVVQCKYVRCHVVVYIYFTSPKSTDILCLLTGCEGRLSQNDENNLCDGMSMGIMCW